MQRTGPEPDKRASVHVGEQKYDAFISYSHSADLEFGSRLQRGLQTLAKAWYQRQVIKVYRDQTDLAATPELLATILRELDRSRFLILMASPEAARSTWVHREIDHWLETRSSSTILIAVTSGGIHWDEQRNDFDWQETSALPKRLEAVYRTEPLWVDLRWARSAKNLVRSNPDFLRAVAQLSAPIRDKDVRVLFDEHSREHRRTLRHAWSAAVALLFLLIISVVLYFQSQANYTTAQKRLADIYQEQGRRELADGRPGRAVVYLASAYALNAARGSSDRGVLPYLIGAASRTLDAQTAVLSGHTDSVRGAAYSQDGSLIATVDYSGQARLWDSTGAFQLALNEVGAVPNSIDVDGRARRILTFSSAASARLWDGRTGRLLNQFRGPASGPRIGFARFSPDGTRILLVMAGKAPAIHDSETGAQRAVLAGNAGATLAGAFSPDPYGKLVLIGGLDGIPRLYDAFTGRLLREFPGHSDAVTAVAFNKDGSRFVTASMDGNARVFEAGTGITLQVLPAFQANPVRGSDVAIIKLVLRMSESSVPAAQFSEDGERVVTSDEDGVRVWDSDFARRIISIEPGSGRLHWVSISRDGRIAATAEQNDTVRLWSLVSGELLAILDSHAAPVRRLVFSPDGSQLLTLSDDRTARIWSVTAAAGQQVLDANAPECPYISFDNPSLLRVGGFARRSAFGIASGTLVKIWNLDTLELTKTETHEEAWPDVYAQAQRYVVLPTGQSAIVKTRDGKQVARLDGHTGDVRNGQVSPDSKTVVTVAQDMTARLWDLQGRVLHVLRHENDVQAEGYSPDGRMVATGSEDGQLRLWDVATGKLQVAIKAHRLSVSAIRVSPDGSRLLTVSGPEGTVRAWRLPKLSLLFQIGVIVGDGSSTVQARFSDDGLLITTAARSPKVEVWDAWLGSLIATLHLPNVVAWDAAATPDRKRIIVTTRDGKIVVFPFVYDQRNVAAIQDLVRSRAALRLEEGRLIPVY